MRRYFKRNRPLSFVCVHNISYGRVLSDARTVNNDLSHGFIDALLCTCTSTVLQILQLQCTIQVAEVSLALCCKACTKGTC